MRVKISSLFYNSSNKQPNKNWCVRGKVWGNSITNIHLCFMTSCLTRTLVLYWILVTGFYLMHKLCTIFFNCLLCVECQCKSSINSHCLFILPSLPPTQLWCFNIILMALDFIKQIKSFFRHNFLYSSSALQNKKNYKIFLRNNGGVFQHRKTFLKCNSFFISVCHLKKQSVLFEWVLCFVRNIIIIIIKGGKIPFFDIMCCYIFYYLQFFNRKVDNIFVFMFLLKGKIVASYVDVLNLWRLILTPDFFFNCLQFYYFLQWIWIKINHIKKSFNQFVSQFPQQFNCSFFRQIPVFHLLSFFFVPQMFMKKLQKQQKSQTK